MANYETSVEAEILSQNTAENSSRVRVKFWFRRTDGRSYGWNYGGTSYVINCEGQTSGNISWKTSWDIPQNTWETVGYYDFTIPHSSDGSKNISFSANLNFNGTSPGTLVASGNKDLTAIPRYLSNQELELKDVTQTTATLRWGAGQKVKGVWTYFHDSDDWTDTPGTIDPAYSGSFVFKGHHPTHGHHINPSKSTLLPGTTYTVKACLQRSDSGLYGTGPDGYFTPSVSFTTKPIPSVKKKELIFQIGNDLPVEIENSDAGAYFLELFARNAQGRWESIKKTTGISGSSYTLSLSSQDITDKLFSFCEFSEYVDVKLVCGTYIDDIEYTNENCMSKEEYIGKAYVRGVNPTFLAFSFSTNNGNAGALIGQNSMLSGQGDLVVQILKESRMQALKGASPLKYIISYGIGGKIIEKEIPYSESNILISLGSFTVAGVYSLSVTAVDSRGGATKVSQSFEVIPYHKPYVSVSCSRYNGFEKEILMEFLGKVSTIISGGYNKNSVVAYQYQIRETGKSFGATATIPSVSTSSQGMDSVLTSNKNSFYNKFLDLDIAKSYDIKFILKDKLETTEVIVSIPQGVAIMELMQDGKILLGIAPDQKAIAEPTKIQANQDIAIQKSNGSYVKVLEEISKVSDGAIYQSGEPANQKTGDTWYRTSSV